MVAKLHSKNRSPLTRDSKQGVVRTDDRPRDSDLARYFRETSVYGVPRAAEELRLAKTVERDEVLYWCAILSHPPAAEYALNSLEEEVSRYVDRAELDLGMVAPLRQLIRIHKRQSGKFRGEQSRNYLGLCKLLARGIRLHDRDRRWVDLCARLVASLVAPQEGVDKPSNQSVLPDTREYELYLERIRIAFERQLLSKSHFVAGNLRLVVSIARRFNRGRMPFIDLIQEGNIGLMMAVERFDHRRGYRFSTYASWWIRHAISRALADKGRIVRLPVHVVDSRTRISRAREAIVAGAGREPTFDELQRATGINRHALEMLNSVGADTILSLDREVGGNDGPAFIDLLQEESPTTPHDQLVSQEWKAEVRRLLTKLTPRESRIIRWRFGFEDGNELTLKDIGAKYKVSRERIRQVQHQALAKIRKEMR